MRRLPLVVALSTLDRVEQERLDFLPILSGERSATAPDRLAIVAGDTGLIASLLFQAQPVWEFQDQADRHLLPVRAAGATQIAL